jgi:hypothetical protein
VRDIPKGVLVRDLVIDYKMDIHVVFIMNHHGDADGLLSNPLPHVEERLDQIGCMNSS